MNDNLKSAILANISLVVLIFLCILFVEGIKATSQGNTMSSNQQHEQTTEEKVISHVNIYTNDKSILLQRMILILWKIY